MIGVYFDIYFYYFEVISLKERRVAMNILIGWIVELYEVFYGCESCSKRSLIYQYMDSRERLIGLSYNLYVWSGQVNVMMFCMCYGCYSQESGY